MVNDVVSVIQFPFLYLSVPPVYNPQLFKAEVLSVNPSG
jgi:hypothetical protein